jgi:hypothetical protein
VADAVKRAIEIGFLDSVDLISPRGGRPVRALSIIWANVARMQPANQLENQLEKQLEKQPANQLAKSDAVLSTNNHIYHHQKEAVEVLVSGGLSPTVANEIAGDGCIDAEDARYAVDTFRANSGLLKSPGAIHWFFKNGTWPVEGVKSLESIQQAAAARSKKAESDRFERIRYQVIKHGRRSGWTEERIAQEIERQVSHG